MNCFNLFDHKSLYNKNLIIYCFRKKKKKKLKVINYLNIMCARKGLHKTSPPFMSFVNFIYKYTAHIGVGPGYLR